MIQLPVHRDNGAGFASNIASAVIQPCSTHGDKKARPWLMSVGVALAGLGIALVGVLQSY